MKVSLFISLFIIYCLASEAQQAIIDRPFSGWGITAKDKEGVICLRRLKIGDKDFFLTVSPESLRTALIPADSIFVLSEPAGIMKVLFWNSPYYRALKRAAELDFYLQDAGLTRLKSAKNGIDLTVDLCPSRLPLDRIVFTDLIKQIGAREKPVPVAISISGRWLQTHNRDLMWLDSLDRTGYLSITWINHSYNHFTDKKAPLRENFMLSKGTDIVAEVIENEKAMLSQKIIPSVFFRFPGLISERDTYDRILALGLIPVGSDAWLAKGQKPGNGSIVLIHANGNEPLGIKEFIKLLHREEPLVLEGRWELLDLRESLARDNTDFK
jgi:hypothetical protein